MGEDWNEWFREVVLTSGSMQSFDCGAKLSAETIDTPPYYGWAVTTGISFTFGGVKINTRGQIVTNAQEPIPGLYAAGEMVGGLFYYNYPGGSGLSAGMVFGRLSGASAAEDAMKLKDV